MFYNLNKTKYISDKSIIIAKMYFLNLFFYMFLENIRLWKLPKNFIMGTNSASTGINNKPASSGAVSVGGNGDELNIATNGGNTQTSPQYTIPGILHFIQHEWSRFEIERSQWDVDRAELQVKIQYYFIKKIKYI